MVALTVFIIVLAISLSVVLPGAQHKAERTRTQHKTFAKQQLDNAIKKFFIANNRKPEHIEQLLSDKNGNRYLRRVYSDPATGNPYDSIYDLQNRTYSFTDY